MPVPAEHLMDDAAFRSRYPPEAAVANVPNNTAADTITMIKRMGLPSLADHSGGTCRNTLDMRSGCHQHPVAVHGCLGSRDPNRIHG